MAGPRPEATPPRDASPTPGGAPEGLGASAFPAGCGAWFFRYRDFAFPLFFLAGAALFEPALPFGSRALGWATDGLGLLLAAAGQALRAAVIGLTPVARWGREKQIHAPVLERGGLFAHTRNPLYLGNGLIVAGLLVLHGSPLFLLTGGAFFLFAYLSITAAEERFLATRFGEEYRRYAASVPRFLPRLRGLGDSLAARPFAARRVLAAESSVAFIWSSGALALLLWKDYRVLGPDAARGDLNLAVPLLAAAALLFAATRALKRRSPGDAGVPPPGAEAVGRDPAEPARRVEELERENAALRRTVNELTLDNLMLREEGRKAP